MARYKIDDVVVDTEKAIESWKEDTWWNGHNHISKATDSQWAHETLYKSRKGRYYLIHRSQWQGSSDIANFVTEQEAAGWLLANDHKLPDDLQRFEQEVCE